jgi:hypothetical protein
MAGDRSTVTVIPGPQRKAPGSVLAAIDPNDRHSGSSASLALESNHILYFERSPVPLPDTAGPSWRRGRPSG